MQDDLKLKAKISKDTMLIARKSDIWHKVEKGILFDCYYDLETTGLSKEYAQPTEFGGMITDIAGNPLHFTQERAKPSDFILFDPYAWVVTRMHEKNLESAQSQYQLAGKIMDFFHVASHLEDAPFQKDFLKLCKKGVYKNADGTTDGYYKYPVLDDKGVIDWDSIRIDDGFKKFYYKDTVTGDWNKRSISAMTIGYNNVNADDQWIWSALHMAGAENIFHTHVKGMGKERLDMLRVIEAAVTLGAESEQGIKSGKKIDPDTLAELHSFTQGGVIEANTRIGSELRGITQGVTNSDGSFVNLKQLHGALRDCMALAAVTQFTRKQVPDVLTQMEMNTNWMHVVERLTENKGGFGDSPVMTYIDKEYPFVTGKMISLIGTDHNRNQPKIALAFDLSYDPQNYHFNGKPLKDLTSAEHAKLIEIGVYKVISTHHSPRLFDAEMGYRAGFNNGIEKPEMHKRKLHLQDPTFIKNAMTGLRIARPKLQGPEKILFPQPEEERFTFSMLEKTNLEDGQNVQILPIANTFDKLAQDARKKAMTIKKLLLRAIEPHENIFVRDYSKNPEGEKYAAEAFVKKIEEINKALRKENGVQLPVPARAVTDKKSAYIYKMQLLHYTRNLFATGAVRDVGQNYWIEDKNGHRIPQKTLDAMTQDEIDDARRADDIHIVYEEVNVTAEIIDRIFDGEGLSDLLGEKIQEHLNDTKAMRHHGIPGLNGADRWYNFSKADRDVYKILNNEHSDSDIKSLEKRFPGAYEKYFNGHHDAQSSLGSYINYLNKKKERFPEFSPLQQARLNIDPLTGMPIENIRHNIDPKKSITAIVPERYFENPVKDPVTLKNVWMLGVSKDFNKASLANALNAGHDVILQSSSTGKKVHLPKAIMMLQKPQEGGAHDQFYADVRARYNESAQEFPKKRNIIAVSGEETYPIHTLEPKNFEAQTMHVDKRHFEGLANHKLAGFPDPLKGIIIYDDGLDLYEGPVRLMEFDTEAQKPTGWEISTQITSVRRATVKQLAQFSDEKAASLGFINTQGLVSNVSREFSNYKLKPKNPANKVWVVEFGRIDPFDPELGTKYFNPAERKISAFTRNYERDAWEIIIDNDLAPERPDDEPEDIDQPGL